MRVLRVALDVPLATLFDYARPDELEVAAGDRVVVPFGTRSRVGVAVEEGEGSSVPAAKLKPIVRVLEDAPRLPAQWLELMRFLATYYQRPLGETVIGALPPRLRSLKPLPKKVREAGNAAPGSPRFVPSHTPTSEQTHAIERIGSALGRFQPFLLHGITGSGKTEVYLRLIARVLQEGGQALVLVPEISLTPQLEARFRHAFPEARIAVMHSALEDVPRTGGLALRGARRRRHRARHPARRTRAAAAARAGGGGRRARHLVQAAGGLALLRPRCRGDPRQARRLPGRARHRHAFAGNLAQRARRALRAPLVARPGRARRPPARGAHARLARREH